MPFTFSHPVIFLPFDRIGQKYFSFTALVIGSITPDFEYFIRMRMRSDFSHTWIGLLLFDLPLALLLCSVFHNTVREPLLKNLPLFLRRRFILKNGLNWKKYFAENRLKVIFSLIIGITTHIVWDGFTHKEKLFVNIYPFLSDKVNVPVFGIMPLYKLLQQISTVSGGAIIALYIYSLPQQFVEKETSYSYWINFILCVILVFALNLLLGLPLGAFIHWVVVCISATLLGLYVASKIENRRMNDVIKSVN